jgi:catechol 2,3-dioxygenase-like lactoylglutathione lyase family enzyme
MTMAEGQILSVAHTGITVSDMDRTLGFFRDVLGFPVTLVRRQQGETFARITGICDPVIDIAYVDAPGHKLEILHYRQPAEHATSTLRPCDNGHLHLAFAVRDIDAVAERVRRAGYEPVGKAPTVDEDGGIRGIYTYGPDGLVIEFMEWLGA